MSDGIFSHPIPNHGLKRSASARPPTVRKTELIDAIGKNRALHKH
jgi:hypothetical protein